MAKGESPVNSDLLTLTPQGLYCPLGDFYIDPWRPVKTAVITHSHGDHAHSGHKKYLTAKPNLELLKSRLGDVDVSAKEYGEKFVCENKDLKVSFHPAGHI